MRLSCGRKFGNFARLFLVFSVLGIKFWQNRCFDRLKYHLRDIFYQDVGTVSRTRALFFYPKKRLRKKKKWTPLYESNTSLVTLRIWNAKTTLTFSRVKMVGLLGGQDADGNVARGGGGHSVSYDNGPLKREGWSRIIILNSKETMNHCAQKTVPSEIHSFGGSNRIPPRVL